MFHPEAVLFGSEVHEVARGADELRVFFESLFTLATTVGWTWDPPLVRVHHQLMWFVTTAVAHVHGDDGTNLSLPYRLSGVLVQHEDRWVFDLFNGSEPAAN